ncbi:MAG: hypothetical protein HW386_1567, partial [Gammaproteobacteria bacterium]|nr:hypothetical protein [Gammaproteobacteria bacterium]
NLHVYLLILLLLVSGLGVMYLKVTKLGLPLQPGMESYIWTVEAEVEFDARSRSASIQLQLPAEQPEYVKLDEYFIARNYGLNVETQGRKRIAEWSIRRARGPQRLYYQADLVEVPAADINPAADERTPRPPERPQYPDALALAVEGLLNQVRSESSDIFTFVSQLLVRLNNPTSSSEIQSITKGITPGTDNWVERIRYILAGAQITTRMLRGLPLEDGKINESLVPWLEVHNDPPNFLRWSVGTDPVLNVKNGKNEQLNFAVTRRPQALTVIAHDRADAMHSPLVAWSLYKLPINTQYLYQILIMVPLGALVVVFMRIIIGIPTFGTFMPVLIALAFRETELLWGISLFLFIVGTGLLFRFYLNNLRLLLVPRLAAVLTLVVMLMLGISLLSNELGLVQGFSIALFPIVIMTMVIERMSITWDESGAIEAFKNGFGSLVVAVLGFLLMNYDRAQHLMYVFPELLLVVLALCLLLGSYTGYRLNELFRFRDLAVEPAAEKVKEDAGTGA